MRQKIRQERKLLSSTFRNNATRTISQTVFSLPEFQSANEIAIYLSNENEVDTQLIIDEAWRQNKNIYLPVLKQDKTLLFCQHAANMPLKKNEWKLYEPDAKCATPIKATNLDIVITPLVGFTKERYRLGRGLGCYDRTFAFLKNLRERKPKLIGIAYEMQKVEFIPEEWDVELDCIVTEEEIYQSI